MKRKSVNVREGISQDLLGLKERGRDFCLVIRGGPAGKGRKNSPTLEASPGALSPGGRNTWYINYACSWGRIP